MSLVDSQYYQWHALALFWTRFQICSLTHVNSGPTSSHQRYSGGRKSHQLSGPDCPRWLVRQPLSISAAVNPWLRLPLKPILIHVPLHHEAGVHSNINFPITLNYNPNSTTTGGPGSPVAIRAHASACNRGGNATTSANPQKQREQSSFTET